MFNDLKKLNKNNFVDSNYQLRSEHTNMRLNRPELTSFRLTFTSLDDLTGKYHRTIFYMNTTDTERTEKSARRIIDVL